MYALHQLAVVRVVRTSLPVEVTQAGEKHADFQRRFQDASTAARLKAPREGRILPGRVQE